MYSFGPVINGIESIAHEKGYHVLIYMTHEDMQKEVVDIQTSAKWTGRRNHVVFVGASFRHHTYKRTKKRKGVPLILFDRITEQIDVTTVTTDNTVGGMKATEHLIERGCKRIAFLAISKTLSVSTGRMNGYLEALKRNSMKQQDDLILYCDGDDWKNKELITETAQKKKQARWYICFGGNARYFDL